MGCSSKSIDIEINVGKMKLELCTLQVDYDQGFDLSNTYIIGVLNRKLLLHREYFDLKISDIR